MRRHTSTVAALAVLALAFTSTAVAKHGPGKANASANPNGKTTICHRAGSGWVKITVSDHALKAHRKHGDIIPAPAGGCPTAKTAQPTAHRTFKATLVPVAPNTTGTGTVKIFTRLLGQGRGRICLQATLTGITAQTGQLWRTATSQLLVSLSRPAASSTLQGCVIIGADTVRQIRQHPENFSVTVGNTTFATALRGTLAIAP
jgi:hypothetical protein